MELNVKAGLSSQYVLTAQTYGETSPNVYFAIGELVTGWLAGLITASQGVDDDDVFWRLASQLASGVADLHRSGIIHLAIQARR